jgi:hypothetical protein
MYVLIHPRPSLPTLCSSLVGDANFIAGCDGVDAATLPWFKISEDAYDGKEWASDKLNSSNAAWTFKIPEEIAPG